MKRKKIPLQYLMIRGTIGKKFVIRHTPWGIIMAKYPDMSKIRASKAQRSCRNIFKEAVAWAKQVIADPVLKTSWQKKLRRRNGVYNEAIKYYMLKEKKAVLQAVENIATKTISTKNKEIKNPVATVLDKQFKHKVKTAVIKAISNSKTSEPIKNTKLKKVKSGWN